MCAYTAVLNSGALPPACVVSPSFSLPRDLSIVFNRRTRGSSRGAWVGVDAAGVGWDDGLAPTPTPVPGPLWLRLWRGGEAHWSEPSSNTVVLKRAKLGRSSSSAMIRRTCGWGGVGWGGVGWGGVGWGGVG